MLKRVLREILAGCGYTLLRTKDCYSRDGLSTVHNDGFRHSPAFQAAYRRGMQASAGVDPQFEWRVHVALWAASACLRVAGDFVECGVNAGFVSSAILHHLNWNAQSRRYFLVDTFQGPVMQQFSAAEVERGRRRVAEAAIKRGGYVTDLERVRANFAEWPDAFVVPGAVPDVLESVGTERVAFLHLDMNCAYPEVKALEHFWGLLSPGGMVLLDDYAYFGYEEQAREIEETAGKLGGEVLSLPTGQGLIIR